MENQSQAEPVDEPGGAKLSRRSFLTGAAVGAVAAGVAVGVPALLTRAPSPVTGEGNIAGATGPVIVYVPDPSKGDVIIMRGERESFRNDATLVSRVVASGEA